MKSQYNLLSRLKEVTQQITGKVAPLLTVQAAKDRICELRREAYEGKLHNMRCHYYIVKETLAQEVVFESEGKPVFTLN